MTTTSIPEINVDDLLQIDADIQTVQDELQVLRAKRDDLVKGATGEYKMLAELLHKHECNSEHTEMCGWYYENPWDENPLHDGTTTWSGGAHKRWLETAIRRVQKSGKTPLEFREAMKVVYA